MGVFSPCGRPYVEKRWRLIGNRCRPYGYDIRNNPARFHSTARWPNNRLNAFGTPRQRLKHRELWWKIAHEHRECPSHYGQYHVESVPYNSLDCNHCNSETVFVFCPLIAWWLWLQSSLFTSETPKRVITLSLHIHCKILSYTNSKWLCPQKRESGSEGMKAQCQPAHIHMERNNNNTSECLQACQRLELRFRHNPVPSQLFRETGAVPESVDGESWLKVMPAE